MHKIYQAYHQKCFDNSKDVNIALLQVRLMPIGGGLPSLATLYFNRPIQALLPQINREPINCNADNENMRPSNCRR